ncbi:MAG: copper chaperone PCu(A)C [Gammaproteobacteria bacterium]|nr:copper chaperone PCu(A)C [Gammaproteobacteria bacterium]
MKCKLLLASALVSVLIGTVQAAPLVVSEPWIRAMPSTSRVIPIFFKLHNKSVEDRALVAIKSSRGDVAIHETVAADGMMKMQPIEVLTISAGQHVMLKPGGYHGMMSHFTEGVPQEGDLVLVTLVYANGEEQDVHIEVVRKMNTGMAMSSLATHGS